MARRILQYIDNEVVALIYYENGNKYIQMQSENLNKTIREGRITKSSAHNLLTCYNTSAEIKDIINIRICFQDKSNSYKIVEESMLQINLHRVFTLLRKADLEDVVDLDWEFWFKLYVLKVTL